MMKCLAIIVALILAASSINASASSLTPETSSVGITYNQATGSSAYGTTYVQLGDATASVVLSPDASVQAQIGNGYTQFVTADLDYYFEVVGGNSGDSVPILITTDLLTSGIYPQYGGASFSVWNGTTSVIGRTVCTYSSDCSATSFSGTFSLSATAGTQYKIHLAATAEGIDAFASVDPYIFIDPAFVNAANYQIDVSDGVGNAPAATPLPATLPLFATGLGALGLLGWRRKKQAQANAA